MTCEDNKHGVVENAVQAVVRASAAISATPSTADSPKPVRTVHPAPERLVCFGEVHGDSAGLETLTSHAWSTPTESTRCARRRRQLGATSSLPYGLPLSWFTARPLARILKNHLRQFFNLPTAAKRV